MKTAGIILAAGYSSRMGALKPALPVGGESAVRRAARILLEAGADMVYVVTGHCAGQVGDALGAMPPSVRTVYNARYDEGMLSSVLAGYAALPLDTGRFFLLPADCAAVDAGTLTALARAYDGCGGAVIYPCADGRRGHPPLIPARFMDGIARFDGRGGLRAWLDRFPSAEVSAPAGVLMDMDTPQAYAALLRHLGLPAYPGLAEIPALLRRHGASEEIIRHGRQVAALADKITALAGLSLDGALLRGAALLHDLARGQPEHARRGATLLLEEGFPDTALLVGGHMDLPAGREDRLDELSVLYLADKLARRGRVRRPEDTLRELTARFSGDAAAARAAAARLHRASALLELLRARHGVTFDGIAAQAPAEGSFPAGNEP